MANISTSVFPATMTRMMYHSLAFAANTSTLVACGGNQVTQIKFFIEQEQAWAFRELHQKLPKPRLVEEAIN